MSALLLAGPVAAQTPALDPALAAASAPDREAMTRLESEALAAHEAGDLAGADALLARLLEIELRVYGPNHAVVANTHAYRATLAQQAGDLAGSEAHRRLELAVREVVDDPVALADARRALGAGMVAEGRFEEALPILIPAHEVLTRNAPASDPRVSGAALALGRSYLNVERSADALAVLTPAAQALADPDADGFGWGGLLALETAFALVGEEQHAQAEPWARLACERWRAGGEHPADWTAEACLTLGEILVVLERTQEATPLLRYALDEQALAPARRTVAADRLIAALTAQGRDVDTPVLRAAYEAHAAAWSEPQTATAYAANRLAVRLREQDPLDPEALELFQEAHRLYALAQGPGGEGAQVTAANAARALVALSRAPDALTLIDATLQPPEAAATFTADQRAADQTLRTARAEVLAALGRRGEALSVRRSLLADLENQGADVDQRAAAHGHIAHLAAEEGDWATSLEHRRSILSLRQTQDSPRALARAHTGYGYALAMLNDDAGAYEQFGQALGLLERVPDAPAGDRLNTLSYMGASAARLGRLGEAETALEAVVAERRERPGEGQALGQALIELARLRADADRFAEAEALLIEAGDLAGDDAGARSFVDAEMGQLLRFMGRYDEAEAALRRVLDYTADTHGANHLLNATPLKNLAVHLSVTGRDDRALDLLLQASAIEAAVLEPDDPRLLLTQLRLGDVYLDLGRLPSAEAMYALVIERGAGNLRQSQEMTRAAVTQLGHVFSLQRRYDDAITVLTDAAALTERQVGGQSRELINTLQLLAYALYMDGRYDETLAIMMRVDAIVDAEGARWPSTVVDVKSNLGRTYIEAGQSAQALVPLRQASALAVRMAREQDAAAGARPGISRAPFRSLVQAAWDVADAPPA